MVPVAEGGEASGREFIDALLDSQPNRLGPAFREKLLRHTRGHPLFTTELLKGMMKRGDLQKNEQGEVIEGPELVWDAIPARVEGVIEERIHRLPEDLQELLVVASVQGESFAAQIAARIQGMSERDALRALDKELHQQHQLVREQGITRVGRQRLSRYRFRHNLIQRYLYGRISQSEREILHEDIAQALEEIYEGQTEEVAGELARHYELAEMPDRATELYLQLGERAMRIFANSEAAELLERGLDLVADLPESAENDERAVRLHLALGRAQWRQGLAPESMATFQRAAHLGRKLNSGVYMAEAALGYDDPRYRFNLPIEPAVELLEKALEALGDGDSVLRVQVVWALIRAQGHEMNETVLGALAENAIAMARRLQDPAALYSALNAGTQALRRPDQIRQRLTLRDEAVEVAAASGDTSSLLDAIMYRTIDLLALAEIDALDAGLATMEEVVEEIGEPFFEYCMLNLRTMRSLLDGRFEEAEAFAHGAMDCSQKMTVDKAEGVYGLQMFSIRRLQGQLESLAPVIRHFVATHSAAESWRPGLALIYSEIGDEESARSEFEALAEAGFGNLPKDSLWLTCQSYLADVCAFLGDSARAGELYDILKPYGQQAVVVGNSITCNGAVSRSLGRLAAVLQDWERAEEHFNHAIAFNEKLGAAPWLAISKFQYAQMLLDRGQAGDPERAEGLLSEAREIAQAIGMHGLKARIAGPGD
jgi:tetratricopeptide (TPR) repeat protein